MASRRAALGAGLLLVLFGAVGCVGSVPQLPDDRYYRLPEPSAAEPSRHVQATVAVALPRSDGLHSERAMLYSHHDRPLEVLRHHYYFWAESPPRLIQEHAIAYLRQTHIAPDVVRDEAAPAAALRLESRLLRFERLVGGATPEVVVGLELQWQAPERAPTPPRAYRVTVPAADDSIYASVQAFGAALTQIYARFLHDAPPP